MVRIGLSDGNSHNYEKFAIGGEKKEETKNIKETTKTPGSVESYIPAQEKQDVIFGNSK